MDKNPIAEAGIAAAGNGRITNRKRLSCVDCRRAAKPLRMAALALAVTLPALIVACSSDNSLHDEADGQVDAIRGDWADATPLFEKAYAAHPDVISEFNLATAYQNSGQNDKAIALYEAVLIDGHYTDAHLETPSGGVPEANPGIFLSDEATNRMAVMASHKALSDAMSAKIRAKALVVEKIMICDFPDRSGKVAGGHGRIFVFVDDDRRTASTMGYFVTAPDQQEMDRFNSDEIIWTQRYQIVGQMNVYHYRFNRQTGALDVTRPAPDTSRAIKASASCHAAKGA